MCAHVCTPQRTTSCPARRPYPPACLPIAGTRPRCAPRGSWTTAPSGRPPWRQRWRRCGAPCKSARPGIRSSSQGQARACIACVLRLASAAVGMLPPLAITRPPCRPPSARLLATHTHTHTPASPNAHSNRYTPPYPCKQSPPPLCPLATTAAGSARRLPLRYGRSERRLARGPLRQARRRVSSASRCGCCTATGTPDMPASREASGVGRGRGTDYKG